MAAGVRSLLFVGTIAAITTLTSVFVSVAAAQQSQPQKFYRPKRFAPPVHAQPSQRQIFPSQRYQQPQQRVAPPQQVQHPRQQQLQQPTYPVRQTGAVQDFDPGSGSRQQIIPPAAPVTGQQANPFSESSQQFLNNANQVTQETADQWRTRSQEAVQGAEEFLRSAVEKQNAQLPRPQTVNPQLHHPSPQQTVPAPRTSSQSSVSSEGTRNWNTPGFSDVSMPDTEIPEISFDDKAPAYEPNSQSNIQPNNPPANSPFARPAPQPPAYRAPDPGFQQSNNTPPARQEPGDLIDQDQFGDEPPRLNDYDNNPFANDRANSAPVFDRSPATNNNTADVEPQFQDRAQSVLVENQPLRDNANQATDQNTNSLRDLRVEPRRLRDTRRTQPNRRGRRNTYQSRYRQEEGSGSRNLQEEGSGSRTLQEEDEYSLEDDEFDDDFEDDFEDDESDQGKGLKSCEEFRAELLNDPITNIVVDISPERPKSAAQGNPVGLTRTWTDCNGNTLGTGTLTGMERSYIVISNELGSSQRISTTRLSDSDLEVVSEFWALPNECSLGCYPFEGRHWSSNTFFWKATSLCHKPLFFENQQLERYGHTHGPIMQPLHSTAHFFTSLLLVPYNAGINPPNECLYALGFYRPGDCAPWLKDPFPISMQGARNQGRLLGILIPVLP